MFNRSYKTRKRCTNCNQETILKIPNGTPLTTWLASGKALCNICGCSIYKVSLPDKLPSIHVEQPQSTPEPQPIPQQLPTRPTLQPIPQQPEPTPQPIPKRKGRPPKKQIEPTPETNNFMIDSEGKEIKVEAWNE